MKKNQDPRNQDYDVPRLVQARLQRDGLLAAAHQFWTHPSGRFTLEPADAHRKRRLRVNHVKPMQPRKAA